MSKNANMRTLRRFFCTECIGQGNDFELITVIKMETRHPVEGSFGSEFSMICNHCRIMAAGILKTPKLADK